MPRSVLRCGCSSQRSDPAFRAELATLVEEIKAKGDDQIIQSANITGDSNVTTQITGSGNVVR